MADFQLRDEEVRDRVRAATEFLDPSMFLPRIQGQDTDCVQMINVREGMDDANPRRTIPNERQLSSGYTPHVESQPATTYSIGSSMRGQGWRTDSLQVSLDEIRAHNREMAEG